MAKRGGDVFGSFQKDTAYQPIKVKPIGTEFSRGSVPGSLYSVNREAAWTRWRRGYEIATSTSYDNDYEYQFKYTISGQTTSGVNPNPVISGSFHGFPTRNKELGMHWAVRRFAGSIRTDYYIDPVSANRLYIESITEDTNYWYVKLAGTWSAGNPLPSPFYIPVSGEPNGLKPANTEIFEDRVLTVSGEIITQDTINPLTQKKYGYVQAVVVNIDQNTGVLIFKKSGSIYATPDGALISPSPVAFEPGRFLVTGSRYCCTCQDFTHRDYAFAATNGSSNKKQFPRSSVASIKPGRYELTTTGGLPDNNIMSSAVVNKTVEVFAPSGYLLDYTVTQESKLDNQATRDYPGVYREFGSIYKRSNTNINLPGSSPDGMPVYDDYFATNIQTDANSIEQKVITEISDNWTPLLDELRYCKHIYALKFKDRVFPPEPSDFPVQIESMAQWEQQLVDESMKDKTEYSNFEETKKALALMDVPPYNCQSPALFPMLQKLFNIATDRITISNFTMIDKNGQEYTP
jgi:hypothetical protein